MHIPTHPPRIKDCVAGTEKRHPGPQSRRQPRLPTEPMPRRAPPPNCRGGAVQKPTASAEPHHLSCVGASVKKLTASAEPHHLSCVGPSVKTLTASAELHHLSCGGASAQMPTEWLALQCEQELTVREGEAFVSFVPQADQLLTAGLDYALEAPIIGRQWHTWSSIHDPHFYFEISPARAFHTSQVTSLSPCSVVLIASAFSLSIL